MNHTPSINCVVQCRVSSIKQSQEGESLDKQEELIRLFTVSKGWQIVPNDTVWSTAISGRKTDREDFEEILAYIKSHPDYVQYYVFRSIDRATRAGGEEYARMKRELAKEGVQMVDTYGVIQPVQNTLKEYDLAYDWSQYSPSEIAETVMATTAKQEVTTILTRMIGQEINLTRQGYRTRCAIDGFKNEKIYDETGKKKPIQIPHPDRAKFYTAMFELRAQGLSDTEIITRVNAMGYRSPIRNKRMKGGKIVGKTGGNLLTLKQLQRAIQKPIYAGVMCEKWTQHQAIRAAYAGLVSIETFNRANRGKIAIKEHADGAVEMIQGNPQETSGKRNRHNPLFPFKFILCHLCHKPFLGSSPRGKSGTPFPTYHCAREHQYFGMSKEEFEGNIIRFVHTLRFRPGLLSGLEATFLNKYRERTKEIVATSSVIHQSIADLKAEQAARIDALVMAKSSVTREKLETDIEALEVRMKEAEQESVRIQITEDDIKAFVREAKKIMEHPAEMLLQPEDMRIQRDLFGLVFEEMPTYEQIASGTPRLSFIFNVFEGIETAQSQVVALRGVEPLLPG